MKKVELLAPAGNIKKLKYAFAYGADAVYCGIPDFSLRVRINQFNLRSLKQGIEYAHRLKKKVYVTANIFAHERHLKKLEAYIKKLKQLGPDALIVSDPGVIAIIKRIWPKCEIHLSTQANCTNSEAVKFWYKQGVKRIILAREVTLKEIKEIHKAAPKVELECFIHGAMCMSYSGRCLLSKFYTNRSANLGDCTQPCRWIYNLEMKEEKRPDLPIIAEQDMHGTYIMNSKDMCLVEYVQDLIKAGIVSLKIEGRAKSIYYLGNTVKVYNEAINQKQSNKLKNKKFVAELMKSQNRGFTTGFLFGKDECEQLDDKSHEQVDWEFCGEVLGSKDKSVKIQVHNQIFIGDQIEFVVQHGKNVKHKVKQMYNENNEEIKEAHGGQGGEVYLPVKQELPEMTLMRRKIK